MTPGYYSNRQVIIPLKVCFGGFFLFSLILTAFHLSYPFTLISSSGHFPLAPLSLSCRLFLLLFFCYSSLVLDVVFFAFSSHYFTCFLQPLTHHCTSLFFSSSMLLHSVLTLFSPPLIHSLLFCPYPPTFPLLLLSFTLPFSIAMIIIFLLCYYFSSPLLSSAITQHSCVFPFQILSPCITTEVLLTIPVDYLCALAPICVCSFLPPPPHAPYSCKELSH